ncbi:hypothetical protein C8R45DRAFT_1078637 [Mycena sanguinolenta]|nr:hypothetical protein C8R45DRAFT_1078637 [Mycena sanguinolenta]
MPSLVSPSLTQAQAYILGGWDLAICFTLFLQGVLCSQFALYMGSTKRDSLQIKLFVAGLALLAKLKSSECLQYLEMYILSLYVSWCSREPHMGFMVFGDLILTGSIIFWLLSAAPLTLCSVINFGVVLLRASAPDTPAFLMLKFITNNILPHLYAWSAMWTLNSRNEIVAAENIRHTLNLGIVSYASDVKAGQTPHASSGAGSGAQRISVII